MSKCLEHYSGLQALHFIASACKGFLGPDQSIKFVTEDSGCEAVFSSRKLLSLLDIEHPCGQLLRDVCLSHHKQVGSGATTLICMAGTWGKAIQALLDEGISCEDILFCGDEVIGTCTQICRDKALSFSHILGSLRPACNDADTDPFVTPAEMGNFSDQPKCPNGSSRENYRSVGHDKTTDHEPCENLCVMSVSYAGGVDQDVDEENDVSWYFLATDDFSSKSSPSLDAPRETNQTSQDRSHEIRFPQSKGEILRKPPDSKSCSLGSAPEDPHAIPKIIDQASGSIKSSPSLEESCVQYDGNGPSSERLTMNNFDTGAMVTADHSNSLTPLSQSRAGVGTHERDKMDPSETWDDVSWYFEGNDDYEGLVRSEGPNPERNTNISSEHKDALVGQDRLSMGLQSTQCPNIPCPDLDEGTQSSGENGSVGSLRRGLQDSDRCKVTVGSHSANLRNIPNSEESTLPFSVGVESSNLQGSLPSESHNLRPDDVWNNALKQLPDKCSYGIVNQPLRSNSHMRLPSILRNSRHFQADQSEFSTEPDGTAISQSPHSIHESIHQSPCSSSSSHSDTSITQSPCSSSSSNVQIVQLPCHTELNQRMDQSSHNQNINMPPFDLPSNQSNLTACIFEPPCSEKLESTSKISSSESRRSSCITTSAAESVSGNSGPSSCSGPHCSHRMPDEDEQSVRETFDRLCLGLSHGAGVSMEFAKDLCWNQVTNGLDFQEPYICRVTGPSIECSKLADGLVLNCSLQQLTLAGSLKNQPKRMTLINGDLTHSFRHAGSLGTPDVKVVTSDVSQVPKSRQRRWLERVVAAIDKFQISLILVKGHVDDDLLDHCSSNGVLVIPQVPYRALQYLSDVTDASMNQYFTDITLDDVIDGILIDCWEAGWQSTIRSLHTQRTAYVKITGDCNLQTMVICGSSNPHVERQEERFWSSYARAKELLRTGDVCLGGGQTEIHVVQGLEKLKDSGRSVAGSVLTRLTRVRIIEAFQEGLEEFVVWLEGNRGDLSSEFEIKCAIRGSGNPLQGTQECLPSATDPRETDQECDHDRRICRKSVCNYEECMEHQNSGLKDCGGLCDLLEEKCHSAPILRRSVEESQIPLNCGSSKGDISGGRTVVDRTTEFRELSPTSIAPEYGSLSVPTQLSTPGDHFKGNIEVIPGACNQVCGICGVGCECKRVGRAIKGRRGEILGRGEKAEWANGSPGEVLDGVSSKIEAWQNAWSLVKVVLNMDVIVTTGQGGKDWEFLDVLLL